MPACFYCFECDMYRSEELMIPVGSSGDYICEECARPDQIDARDAGEDAKP